VKVENKNEVVSKDSQKQITIEIQITEVLKTSVISPFETALFRF